MKLKAKIGWVESFSSVRGKGQAKAIKGIWGKKLEKKGSIQYYKLTLLEHYIISYQYYGDKSVEEATESASSIWVPEQIPCRFCDFCNKESGGLNEVFYFILDDGLFPHYSVCPECFKRMSKAEKEEKAA
jgi:hypothetical protein